MVGGFPARRIELSLEATPNLSTCDEGVYRVLLYPGETRIRAGERSRDWKDPERAHVARTDQGEVTPVQGVDARDTKALRQRHDRGVNEADTRIRVPSHQLGGTSQVAGLKTSHRPSTVDQAFNGRGGLKGPMSPVEEEGDLGKRDHR